MDILDTLRKSILMAFRALPILFISFTAFLAIGLGNLGMFVLFFGQAVLVPIVTSLTHMASNKLLSDKVFVPGTDIVQLVPSSSTSLPVNVVPSFWMQHVLFFLGYLLANGVAILTLTEEKGQPEYLVQNRKAKANTVIAVAVVAAILLSYFRSTITGNAETLVGVATSFVTGGALGYGWYQFAAYCGARHADVFGVVPTILPVSAKEQKAMACVYAPKP
jgi:hypothetical protein